MTHRMWLVLTLLIALAELGASPAQAQTAAPVFPALVGLDQPVALTATDVTLGQAAAFISDQTGYTIVADPRYRDLRVSLAGAQGTFAEVVSAMCLATGMEVRRLDRYLVLSPAARGIAVVGREIRAQYAPRLRDDYGQLVVQRSAAARQALGRLGLGTPDQALSQLSPWQLGAFQSQGYLTVAQLFPEYYLPLYDVFGDVIDGRGERPPSLPEFAGTRVYLDPALRLELHVPGAAGGPAVVWPIDIIPAGER